MKSGYEFEQNKRKATMPQKNAVHGKKSVTSLFCSLQLGYA